MNDWEQWRSNAAGRRAGMIMLLIGVSGTLCCIAGLMLCMWGR
jgi:hypothetical protein